MTRLPRLFLKSFKIESQTNNNKKKKGKKNIDEYLLVFGIISDDFLYYIDRVCCVYSLESPRSNDSNRETQRNIPIMSPVRAL